MRSHRRAAHLQVDAPLLARDPPAQEPAEIALGPALIAGYRVVRLLSAGSRAEVLLAQADDGGGAVALKLFRPGCSASDVDRELLALSSHSSAHLPALRDVASLDDGRCVAVLDRLSGPVLAALMRERGASWQPGELVTIAAPLVGALAAAHAAGFAHGALSARTVMFDETGSPQLIGLGHTVATSARLGEPGIAARAAVRADYERFGELLNELFEQLAQGEEIDAEAFEEWFAAKMGCSPFEPFAVDLERRLLEMAVPIPVRTDAAAVARGRLLTRVPVVQTPQPVRAGLLSTFTALAFLPDELGEVLDRGRLAVTGRFASIWQKVPRGRPLILAGGLGVALIGCVLWLLPVGSPSVASPPSGSAGSPTSETEVPHPAEPAEPGPGRPSEPSAETLATVDGDDPVAAFAALIELRAACLPSLAEGCLSNFAQRSSAIEAADSAAIRSAAASGGDVVAVPRAVSSVQLVERTGDAAIVRYSTPESETASALMIRTEAGWRLRELFEPSGSTQDGA